MKTNYKTEKKAHLVAFAKSLAPTLGVDVRLFHGEMMLG